MNPYAPHTPDEIADMLATIGVASLDDLVAHVPAGLRASAAIGLAPGMTESGLRAHFATLAAGNRGAIAGPCFAGAGVYPRLVPVVVDSILRRAEFATAYTPYQPEVSQGTLQAIYEFQTYAAMLLGLDVANASMYDGASATAEAVLMARRLLPDRHRVLLARTLHPHYREVVRTYVQGLEDVSLEEVPFGTDGRLDETALTRMLGDDGLCVVAGYPNVFGVVEDLTRVSELTHAAGAVAIAATAEPMALAALRSPGACGVDIAVAEGQGLGLPMSFGGPGVGLFAARERFVRAMPGRLVGETVDVRGRRGFVLTLATREQHIRRERATSNICTNQGLCSLAVCVYLSMLGRDGLRRTAAANVGRAHEVVNQLAARGVTPVFAAPFFNEFVVRIPNARRWWEEIATREGMQVGVPLDRWYPELPDALVVCVTEAHTAEECSRLVECLAAGAKGRG